jgi:hypothetical protein
MTDKDLLERAARAIGFKHDGACPDGTLLAGRARWNPLTDDGDALRLAVKLRLQIDVMPNDEVFVEYGAHADSNLQRMREVREQNADPLAATRRAIVRAAAALGDAK